MDGKLIWITGLAGSGKTTIAMKVYLELIKTFKNTVHLDGDTMRELLGNASGYSTEERKKIAFIYAKFCH